MKINRSSILLLINSLSSGFYINLIGRLTLAECVSFFLLFSTKINFFKRYKLFREIFIAFVLLFIIQVTSDLVNNVSFNDLMKGSAVIIFSIISIIFFINNFENNENGILYYFFGLFIIRLFFGHSEIDFSIIGNDTNYFKSRIVVFLNPLILFSIFCFALKGKHKLSLFVILIYSLLCVYMDARSNGLIYFISFSLLSIKVLNLKISKSLFFVILIIVFCFIYGGYCFYIYEVLNSNIGGSNAINQISLMSNPYNPFKLIYYGRSEFFVLLQAGIDSPLFGHGSWAKDTNHKYELLQSMIMGRDITTNGYISAHSILLGYFAYGGVGSLLCILYVFYKLFLSSFNIIVNNKISPIIYVILVMSIDMVWAFLFSPIGALRTTFPPFAALIIMKTYRNSMNVIK